MSYSLAISNGDLVRQGSNLAVVWGIDKLKQDLQLWVAERFGGDRFHTNMGSTLQDYIGTVVSRRTKAEIEDEVMRMLDNYQRVQVYGFKREPRHYSLTQLLERVSDINISVTYDYLLVSVSIVSAAQAPTKIVVSQGV
jgi:phage baseplate assembly protein W